MDSSSAKSDASSVACDASTGVQSATTNPAGSPAAPLSQTSADILRPLDADLADVDLKPQPSGRMSPGSEYAALPSATDRIWPSEPRPARRQPGLSARAEKHRLSLALWLLAVVYTALFSYYASETLLSPSPRLGRLLLAAADTNLLISVLSQVYVTLLAALFASVFDSLRWHFVAAPTGMALASFFELSAGTSWLAILMLISTSPSPRKSWGGIIRAFILPVAWILLGSMLKYQSDFKEHFQQTGDQVDVFSGIYPLDVAILTQLNVRDADLYYNSWTAWLLQDPKYAVAMSDETCSNCTSYFLPGGIETTRRVGKILNSTLLQEGHLASGDSVQILNAPGLFLKFMPLDASFQFNLHTDCATYGQQFNDSLQLCAVEAGNSIAVGWRACPTSLHDLSLCQENTTWMEGPLKTQLLLTATTSLATTSYQRSSLTILNSSRTSDTVYAPITASDLNAIWNTILRPKPDAIQADVTMINALTFSLGWVIRLYDDFFPDDRMSPREYLQNFIAVPLQFMAAGIEFANTSFPDAAPAFAMPANMTTMALAGTSMQRLIGQPWVVWTFVTVSCAMVTSIGAVVVWMILSGQKLQPGTSIPEFGILGRASGPPTAPSEDMQVEMRKRMPSPNNNKPATSILQDDATHDDYEEKTEIETLLDFTVNEGLADISLRQQALRIRQRRVRLLTGPPEAETQYLSVERAK